MRHPIQTEMFTKNFKIVKSYTYINLAFLKLLKSKNYSREEDEKPHKKRKKIRKPLVPTEGICFKIIFSLINTHYVTILYYSNYTITDGLNSFTVANIHENDTKSYLLYVYLLKHVFHNVLYTYEYE